MTGQGRTLFSVEKAGVWFDLKQFTNENDPTFGDPDYCIDYGLEMLKHLKEVDPLKAEHLSGQLEQAATLCKNLEGEVEGKRLYHMQVINDKILDALESHAPVGYAIGEEIGLANTGKFGMWAVSREIGYYAYNVWWAVACPDTDPERK